MKKLTILILVLLTFYNVNGQSKKEQIVILNLKIDSLKNMNKILDSVLYLKSSAVNSSSIKKAQQQEHLDIISSTYTNLRKEQHAKRDEYHQAKEFIEKYQDTITGRNERLLINMFPDKLRRNQDTLMLTLNNGSVLKYIDESKIGVEKEGENGEEVTIYSDYLSYSLGNIMFGGNYYLVEFSKTTLRGFIAVMGEDGNNILLINSNSGQIDSLVSEPKFSPDKKRYLSLGFMTKFSMGGILIRNTENNKIELNLSEYLGKMMEGEPEWISDTSIKFTTSDEKILKINWNGIKWVISK